MAVLRGLVKERNSNRVIPWLMVSLDGAMATTNQNGMFIFRGVSVGKHRLSVRSESYRPITIDIEIDSDLKSINVLVDRNTL